MFFFAEKSVFILVTNHPFFRNLFLQALKFCFNLQEKIKSWDNHTKTKFFGFLVWLLFCIEIMKMSLVPLE